MADDELMRSEQEVNYELDELWSKVNAQNIKVLAGLGLGALGVGLSLLANLALAKMMKTLGEFNTVLTEHHNILRGAPGPVEQPNWPPNDQYEREKAAHIAHGAGIDETRVAPAGMTVGEAASGPASEVSDEVRAQLARDAELDPARLMKGDSVAPKLDETQVNTEGKLP